VNTGLSDKRIHTLAIAPNDPQTLYAGTDNSGVYVTVDGGGTWSSANTGFPAFSYQSKTFSPPFNHIPESEIIDQAMLEEFNPPPDRAKSLSFGGTNVTVISISVDEANPSLIYVGTDGDGVFRSVDGGISWSPTGLTAVRVNEIGIDPSNPANIYAGVPGSDGSLLWSFNSGVDWLFMNVGLNNHTVYSLAFDPSDSSKMYAGTAEGIFLSSNGGNSWTPSTLNGVAVYSTVVSPSDGDVIYAGTKDGYYFSSDSGATWTQDNRDLINLVLQSLHVSVDDIYLGSMGGGAYRRRGVFP
jgi:photosystem II stability/assembly factor-like uncharacterized protein